MAWSVQVDFDLCKGNAMCMGIAPEIFQVDNDGALELLLRIPPDALRGKVEEAILMCPTSAITIKDA